MVAAWRQLPRAVPMATVLVRLANIAAWTAMADAATMGIRATLPVVNAVLEMRTVLEAQVEAVAAHRRRTLGQRSRQHRQEPTYHLQEVTFITTSHGQFIIGA
jgi:hypothetical protein